MKESNRQSVPAAVLQLRAEFEGLPRSGTGKRRQIPQALKERTASLFAESGMSTAAFLAALRLSPSALSKWRAQFGEKSATKRRRGDPVKRVGFRNLEIMPNNVQPSRYFTIEGPGGIKITGLTAEELAKLWRTLC